MFKQSALLFVVILAVTPSQSIAQNLVMNGDFSTGTDGWTITNIPGFTGYHSSVGNPGGTLHLDNTTPSLGSDPTASQLIMGLVPGAKYTVSGDYRQGKIRGTGLPDGPSLGVAIDDVYFFTAEAPGNFNTWYDFNFDYMATSAVATLELSTQINGTGGTYYFDNIAITAIPEPASLALLTVCMFAFTSRRYRFEHH